MNSSSYYFESKLTACAKSVLLTTRRNHQKQTNLTEQTIGCRFSRNMNKLLLCLVVSSITCCLCASVRNSNSSRHSGRRQRNGQSKVKEFRCRFVEQLDSDATDCQMFRKNFLVLFYYFSLNVYDK